MRAPHPPPDDEAPWGVARIDCPSCERGGFTRRDMLWANVDGSACCTACGGTVRLDLFGRWVLSCLMAIVLPTVLLYGNVFYSGHLFLVSIAVIFGVWRGLCFLMLPYLTLEPAPVAFPVGRRTNLVMMGVLLAGAVSIDAMMASRFESPELAPEVRSARAVDRLR